MQQTHYDTLKVSQDAPIEVIRAAYRVLSLKYHPDRQPADPAAADTMGLLNKAYEVLSDPERRLAYDAWIRQIKAESSHVQRAKATTSRPARVDPDREIGSDAALSDRFALHLRQFGTLYGVAVLVLVSVSLVVLLSLTHEPKMNGWMAVTPAPEDREAYIRQVARDLMLRRSEYARGSAAVPAVPETGALPSSNSSASATEREKPVRRAAAVPAVPETGALPSNNSPASATEREKPVRRAAAVPAAPETGALPSSNSPASTTEREKPVRRAEAHSNDDAPQPSDTAPSLMHLGEEALSTPELPSLPQSNEDAADRATHSFESQLLGRDAVGGTE